MKYNTDFTIFISQTDLNVIGRLYEALKECPYDLTDEDFGRVIIAIANEWDSAENVSYLNNKNINIVYENEEEENEGERYCGKCKHFYKDSIEEPCNECLTSPVNERSHKPVNFEEE